MMNDECGMMNIEPSIAQRNDVKPIPHSLFIIHHSIAAPPWTLRGDTFAFCDRVLDNRIGVRAFVHYAQSPVGAYNEMACAIWTRRGVSVVEMPVTLESSMIGGRENWGYPKTLEDIQWTREGNRVLVRFRGRDIRVRLSRFSFPLSVKSWTVQKLDGNWVRAPLEISGRAHFVWVGKRLGIFIEDFTMTVFAPEKL